MYWTILKGNVAGKGKKNPPQGVSTFCHLEGATDNECINILNLVQLLSSHSVDYQWRNNGRQNENHVITERRCLQVSLKYIKDQLAFFDVSTLIWITL